MAGLYPTLLRILREAERPLTSAELFDPPEVKAHDVDSVRVYGRWIPEQTSDAGNKAVEKFWRGY